MVKCLLLEIYYVCPTYIIDYPNPNLISYLHLQKLRSKSNVQVKILLLMLAAYRTCIVQLKYRSILIDENRTIFQCNTW